MSMDKRDAYYGARVRVAPHFIEGDYEADEWSGKEFTIVSLHKDDAGLSTSDAAEQDDTDANVFVSYRRLTLVREWEVG